MTVLLKFMLYKLYVQYFHLIALRSKIIITCLVDLTDIV
jgi:hypothetical protein